MTMNNFRFLCGAANSLRQIVRENSREERNNWNDSTNMYDCIAASCLGGNENKYILSPRSQITSSRKVKCEQRKHDELESKLTLMSSVIEKITIRHGNFSINIRRNNQNSEKNSNFTIYWNNQIYCFDCFSWIWFRHACLLTVLGKIFLELNHSKFRF